jgi:hypothetical protein
MDSPRWTYNSSNLQSMSLSGKHGTNLLEGHQDGSCHCKTSEPSRLVSKSLLQIFPLTLRGVENLRKVLACFNPDDVTDSSPNLERLELFSRDLSDDVVESLRTFAHLNFPVL